MLLLASVLLLFESHDGTVSFDFDDAGVVLVFADVVVDVVVVVVVVVAVDGVVGCEMLDEDDDEQQDESESESFLSDVDERLLSRLIGSAFSNLIIITV